MRRLPLRLGMAFLVWTVLEWPIDAAVRRCLPDVVVAYPSVRGGEVPLDTCIRVDLRRPVGGALLLLAIPLVILVQQKAIRAERTPWVIAMLMMAFGLVHFLLFQAGPWTFALFEGLGLPLSKVPWYFNPLRSNSYRFLELPGLLAVVLLGRRWWFRSTGRMGSGHEVGT